MAQLPDRGWSYYEGALRRLGERRPDPKDGPALKTLAELQLVTTDMAALTDLGQRYFAATFIRGQADEGIAVLGDAVRSYPPSAAVCQLLWGVAGANKTTVETVLRSQGFDAGLTDRSIGSLLMLMNQAGLIEYARTSGSVRVLHSPLDESAQIPESVFISPRTPFGNKVWLSRVIGECTGSIRWLDKHFMPVAFEQIWEAADANRVSSVRLLSLLMPDHEGRRPQRQYRELANRGIKLEWRTIDSKLVRDTHDRWIIGEGEAWNVPNVNAIFTGQNSELHRTDDFNSLATIFDSYWDQAIEFDSAKPEAPNA
jgi:hypothetical protein